MKTWDEMTPRERDELIAERVMGGLRDKYSTDRVAAGAVVGRMWERGHGRINIHPLGRYGWDVTVEPFGPIRGRTLPEAVCLAALHAVETETNTEDDR